MLAIFQYTATSVNRKKKFKRSRMIMLALLLACSNVHKHRTISWQSGALLWKYGWKILVTRECLPKTAPTANWKQKLLQFKYRSSEVTVKIRKSNRGPKSCSSTLRLQSWRQRVQLGLVLKLQSTFLCQNLFIFMANSIDSVLCWHLVMYSWLPGIFNPWNKSVQNYCF